MALPGLVFRYLEGERSADFGEGSSRVLQSPKFWGIVHSAESAEEEHKPPIKSLLCCAGMQNAHLTSPYRE